MSRAASKGRSAGGFVVATALLLATAFVGSADAQDTDGLIPEGHWTDEQITELLDLIDRTETELPENFPASGPRSDVEAELVDRGYYNFGVPSQGYWHMINPAYTVDDHMVNPATAESLVYQDDGAGNWELVSAMFIAGPDDTVDDLPDDVAWLPGWHGHPELCNNPDGTFGGIRNPDTEECPEGTFAATTPVMMHVWIVDNGICDHRFGGIGVGGVHCEIDHGHDPGHDDPPPPHDDPPGDDPSHDDHDDDGQDDDGQDDDGQDDEGHDDDQEDGGQTPPAAQPVTGTPSFTG